MSLLDFGASEAPFLSPGHPFENISLSNYWTSNTRRDNISYAFYVNFSTIYFSDTYKINRNSVWPVRDFIVRDVIEGGSSSGPIYDYPELSDYDGQGGVHPDYREIGNLGSHCQVSFSFWASTKDINDSTFRGTVTSDIWDKGRFHNSIKLGKLEVYLHIGGTDRGRLTSNSLTYLKLHHFVITADLQAAPGTDTPARLQLYMDGDLIDQTVHQNKTSFSLDSKLILDSLIMGYEEKDRYLDGQVGCVKIYSKVLSQEEVTQLFKDKCPKEENDL